MDIKRFNQLHNTFDKVMKTESEFIKQVINNNMELFVGSFKGLFTIAIVGGETDTTFVNTKLIAIEKVGYKDKPTLLFSLKNEMYLDIFISFILDLELVFVKKPKATWTDINNRYIYWQSLFRQERGELGENEIKGLLNELLVLARLIIPKYGVKKAIIGWNGTNKFDKDFAYDDLWYEAKAINNNKLTVQISSLSQLESDSEGIMIVSQYEKTSADNQNGLCILDLFNEINDLIDCEEDRNIFIDKIFNANVDVVQLKNPNYYVNQTKFILHDTKNYLISENFPRLRKDDINLAIGNVKYEIILAEIENYITEFI